jgi:hypothetical protein
MVRKNNTQEVTVILDYHANFVSLFCQEVQHSPLLNADPSFQGEYLHIVRPHLSMLQFGGEFSAKQEMQMTKLIQQKHASYLCLKLIVFFFAFLVCNSSSLSI